MSKKKKKLNSLLGFFHDIVVSKYYLVSQSFYDSVPNSRIDEQLESLLEY